MTILVYLHKDTTIVKGDEAFYAGSDSCMQCHQKKHTSWHGSSHPKIFKKYTDESQIIADFKNKPDFVKFDKKDIDVIIGYQWEQVFAREIDGEYYPFPAKWMNLTKKWIPYKTKKWKKTPLTQKCNGCHTTGLNKKTGEFKEYGVSCESCHGPASKHVQNKSMLKNIECNICHNSKSLKEKLEKEVDIVRTIKSAVCGQCHSRGTENTIITHQTEVQFNFPVEYLPGQEISKNFKPTTPQTDKKGKNWWGNGISKNRHQEYADFAKSGHSSSLKNLRTKRRESCVSEPEDKCLKCHSGDYIQAKKYQKRMKGKKEVILPTINNAQDDITCVVCHNPHKVGDKKTKASDMCVECHTKDTKTMKEQKKHYPCSTKKITCADCHMPRIVKTGGKFSLRSHAFKIIPPEATIKYGMPNSCQNGSCHQDKSTQWAIDEYKKFYKRKDKILAEVVKEIK
ncbi:MAG: cytochrome C [Arcobacteraceae bacterium]|nr:cytochrome C [Arcobacteraceae bacterium]